jgi:signal transduction histidine kinase
VLDTRFTILAVTDTYLRATMTQRDAIVGRGIFEVFPDNPYDPTATGVRNLRASLDRVLCQGMADTMAVQRYDIPKSDSPSGEFEERYWSPINSPVFDRDGRLAYIIHRVEDVTEFVHLTQANTTEHLATKELRERALQMQTEIFLRSQELAEANLQLEQAHRDVERQVEERTQELQAALKALHEMATTLEHRVDERTMALQAANEQLQAHDRRRSSFVSIASHELRTPITAVKGYAENMLNGVSGPLSEKQTYYLTRMSFNLDRLARMVHDLLELSRIETGEVRLNVEPVCLLDLLMEAVENLQGMAKKKLITMHLHADRHGLGVRGDRDKLYQIVTNLLENAVKYSDEGSQVQVNARPLTATSVQLCVSDAGCGIPPEELNHIFDSFYRGKEALAATRGAGLGLAITKRLVELHNGRIWVDSTWKVGSNFYVVLPTNHDLTYRLQTVM